MVNNASRRVTRFIPEIQRLRYLEKGGPRRPPLVTQPRGGGIYLSCSLNLSTSWRILGDMPDRLAAVPAFTLDTQ